MNGKELVLSAIAYEKTPRVPTAVLDGYTWMLKRSSMSHADFFGMEADKAADYLIETYEELGSDMIFSNIQAIGAVKEVMGGKVDFSTVGAPAATLKAPLAEAADIKNFSVDDVFDKAVKTPVYQKLAGQQRALNDKIGKEKLICSCGLGPLTMAAGLLGMQPLMMALMEDPDEVKYLLDFANAFTAKMMKFQADNGATAVSLADPLSTINLISDDTFAKFSLPGLKYINGEMKAYDKEMPIMLHICGNTVSRLAPLVGSGIDIFSVDSIDLEAAMAVINKDYALFGNLSTTEVLLSKTAEEVHALAKEKVEMGLRTSGFILAPGCELAPDTPLENILAMTSAARE